VNQNFTLTAFSWKSPEPSGGWVLFYRLIVCGFGVFLLGGAIYLFIKQAHHLSVGLVILAVAGLVLICLGIFTSAKTCEKIADVIFFGL
jgi:hypothetical membrane protein